MCPDTSTKPDEEELAKQRDAMHILPLATMPVEHPFLKRALMVKSARLESVVQLYKDVGGAGSGESEIRRCVLENDLVEAIVGLPNDMFYNTGIATYVWVLSNKKPAERKGKVQLINGVNHCGKMRKSLGS